MPWYPTFKLFASNGSTLIATFHVIATNWPYEQPSFIELNSLRSQGAIIIPGGDKAYDLELRCIVFDDNYTDLTTQIFALKTDIVANTPYVLKIDKSNSSTDNINVIRIEPIQFDDSIRTRVQYYTIRFKALAW
jgi:hypothetical protein